MEQRGGNPPFGRSERSRQWNGTSLELFPSRAYGENGGEGSRPSRAVTPMATSGEHCLYNSVPHQEFLRTPAGNAADSANLRSWDNMGPPMSSAPDRITEPHRRSGLPLAPEISQSTREWVAVTAYQPVDVVTRTVEVPVTRTVDVYVPKPIMREKIVEVPKFIPKYIEKIVEVPQIEWVERIVEVPEVVYNTKIVPKVEIRENIVEKPVFHQKWVEKIVEVSVVEEVIRYRTIHEPEEIIKYIPSGHQEEEWRGAPILTVPPHQTPELPPKWGGTPQPSPRHPLVQAATQRSE